MRKKSMIIPALLLSTAILTNQAYAEEATNQASEASAPSTVVQAQQPQSEVAAIQTIQTGQDNTGTAAPQASTETVSAETNVTEQTTLATTLSAEKSVAETPVSAPVTAQETATQPEDEVTILHTNDMHGRFAEEAKNGVIGMSKLAGVAEESRQKEETLVLDSGDATQGLPITNNSKGEDAVALMNAAGYDAMTLGNHEFDFGLDQLKTLSKKMTFPVVSANVYVDGARLFQASTIIDKNKSVDGDEFVVIGVTTPETATKTHPKNVVGVTFTDPITEVNNVIAQTEAQARAEGKAYNNYIILAHLGVDTTTKEEWRGDTLAKALSENKELAGKKVIVLDGHSHTAKSETFGNVTYNQTGSYLNNVGIIKLNSKEVLSNTLLSAADAKNVTPETNVKSMVEAIQAKYKADSAKVVIPNSPVELSGQRENVRVRETNLGNVVADALLDYGQTGFSHKSNLAVTNGGGLRETIAKDKPVTKGDIIAVLPFGNNVAQIAVTGQQIKDMFKKSLGSILQADENGNPVLDENGNPLLEPSGGFLQIAGAKVYYDTKLEPEKRILSVEIFDPETNTYKPLNATENYYLVTNDFLAAGGDGYDMLGGPREEGPSMDTVFADYLQTANLSQYAVINPNSRSISVDSALDTDKDGFADYLELIAGTDTKNAKDYPGAQAVQPKPAEEPAASSAIQPKASAFKSAQNEVISVAVNYKAAAKPEATAHQTSLPTTGDQESIVMVLLGLSLTSLCSYALRRRSYGK